MSISGEELTIRSVLIWLKETLLKNCDRIDLLLEGDAVRPGVLVLVNDTDWELLDEVSYTSSSSFSSFFIHRRKQY